jgi:hypothetical protein
MWQEISMNIKGMSIDQIKSYLNSNYELRLTDQSIIQLQIAAEAEANAPPE